MVLDRDEWTRRLVEAFAAAYRRAESPRVDRLRPVGPQETSDLWRFRVRWREPDGPGEADLALRVGLDPEGAAACQREARALRLAAAAELPVPVLWLVGPSGAPAFLAYEWIVGETFDLAWRRRRRDATAELLAHLLVEIHSQTGDRRSATSAGTIGDLLARLRRLAEDGEALAAQAEVEALGSRRPRSVPAVLCHGDFRPTKVLLTGEARASVVGWTHAGYGDPRLDLARTIARLDDEYGGILRAPFLKAYRRERPVDPDDLAWFERLARLEWALGAVIPRGARNLSGS